MHASEHPKAKHPSPFSRFAQWVAHASGTPPIFAIAVVIVIGWAASGPLFHFSDTWQLVINTGTTIVTFLMVFLIQNTQNRDTAAMQAKLDELIRATRMANNVMMDLEDVDDETLARLREHYRQLAAQAPGDINKMLDEYERHMGRRNDAGAEQSEETVEQRH
jgi:low affinity Fe/Cu permease